MRRLALLVAILVAPGLLGSCGGHSSISAGASSQLETRAQAIRAAASAHDPAQAAAQLAAMRAQVTRLEQQGQISPSKAQAILAAADAVQAQLATIPVPPPSTTSTTPPAQLPAPGHGQAGDQGGGHGDGGGGD